jgi:hypothetical protein
MVDRVFGCCYTRAAVSAIGEKALQVRAHLRIVVHDQNVRRLRARAGRFEGRA